ncbi:DUF2637 domain-containing protein [Streptomyces sp. IpFD-1.1]|uniref:DUF2637 domain-containing protein n=1 Tax=unclassified Streptomyces TaxID=2593676 RepID=UPI001C46AD0D|nr:MULTISPECIES: DUF2637 domain-containing protein [unclassified Streptomyces]MBV7255132.1 DUF2637 domain-containing protein [Streptomyces sp. S-2]MCO6752553.1 DUF2637 domain-containing protein [Streptomyces sp. IpFD-1.1]
MQRVLVGVVVAGAVVIAAIGFAGSYTAVRELALQKGFGTFSYFFPIGIDAGICVLLALDLLLTWMRIPFPMLRQTAWLLTAATIAFNGAAAWPDPLGVGMHAVIPVLFVVAVEAARHAIGRIADITADKHMEGVRITRWLLSPLPTFLLWRRMKLWELRSYEQVIKLEQERLVYQARLRSRFGRAWRRKAPVESLMPLRLARYGVPLAETAPAGLAAAGIEPALLPPAPAPARQELERADRPVTETDPAPAPTTSLEKQPADRPAAQAPEDVKSAAERGSAAEPARPGAEAVDVDEPAPAFAEQPLEERPAPPWLENHRTDGVRGGDRVGASHSRTNAPETVSARPRSLTETVGFPRSPSAPSATPVPEPVARLSAPPSDPQPALDVSAGEVTGAGHRLGEAASMVDQGAAARVPEPRTEVAPEDLPADQQIKKVAEWLTEAQRSGSSLPGAEVARRLKVSPRTGQRRVTQAEEFLEEQRRAQGRGHLRSVRQ